MPKPETFLSVIIVETVSMRSPSDNARSGGRNSELRLLKRNDAILCINRILISVLCCPSNSDDDRRCASLTGLGFPIAVVVRLLVLCWLPVSESRMAVDGV